MRWTRTLIPTLKETPQEAVIKSHRLMLRAGLIRKLASGTYNYLPLGMRSLRKAERIVREEMDRAGALEVLLPALHPKEIWVESGRFDILGDDMIHFKDRHGKWNVLGPTHEEIITDLVRRDVRSYKQLPVTLYQIQTKFRDEMRPRSGVIRSREFVMKDAYSFHATPESLDETYNLMRETYKTIFRRCGLDFYVVQADPGAMGGSGSQEFVLFSDAGEDRMVQFGDSDTVMSVEMASRKLKASAFPKSSPGKPVKVMTPGHSSVESVAQYLKKTAKDLVKTMIYQRTDGSFFEVIVRGDHEVSEFKLKKAEPGSFMASREAIEKLGSAFGFSGPFGKPDLKMYVDEDVVEMKNFITGANERDAHLIDVNLGDFQAREFIVGDWRQVAEGDTAPDGQPFRFRTAIELGHIFKLNLRYSEPMKAHFVDDQGKDKPVVMGCYGIGVNRILAASIEQHADDKGIVWPKAIAPYQVLVVLVDAKNEEARRLAEGLETGLEAIGIDCLVDDRADSAGVKFNDADLIGIPLRVILGPKGLKEGKAEIKLRKTGETVLIDASNLLAEVRNKLDKID